MNQGLNLCHFHCLIVIHCIQYLVIIQICSSYPSSSLHFQSPAQGMGWESLGRQQIYLVSFNRFSFQCLKDSIWFDSQWKSIEKYIEQLNLKEFTCPNVFSYKSVLTKNKWHLKCFYYDYKCCTERGKYRHTILNSKTLNSELAFVLYHYKLNLLEVTINN